jgi:CRISPR-associated protein Cas2
VVYVILVYDVGVDRVNKVLKISREYLTWVQNSVLEGEITDADIITLSHRLRELIDETADSVTFYIMNRKYENRLSLGRIKGEPTVIF